MLYPDAKIETLLTRTTMRTKTSTKQICFFLQKYKIHICDINRIIHTHTTGTQKKCEGTFEDPMILYSIACQHDGKIVSVYYKARHWSQGASAAEESVTACDRGCGQTDRLVTALVAAGSGHGGGSRRVVVPSGMLLPTSFFSTVFWKLQGIFPRIFQRIINFTSMPDNNSCFSLALLKCRQVNCRNLNFLRKKYFLLKL